MTQKLVLNEHFVQTLQVTDAEPVFIDRHSAIIVLYKKNVPISSSKNFEKTNRVHSLSIDEKNRKLTFLFHNSTDRDSFLKKLNRGIFPNGYFYALKTLVKKNQSV